MKKVSVITMQGVYNYGAALQTYATGKIIEKAGAQPEIVRYDPPRMKDYGSLRQIYEEAVRFHGNKTKCKIIALMKYPAMKKLNKVFHNFDAYTERWKGPVKYEEIGDLKKFPPIADIYMTGSDQVWNNFFEDGKFDETYFLSYAPDKARKVSYASSFGKRKFTKEEMNEIRPLLERYDAISVRERDGLKILNDVDVKEKRVCFGPNITS